MGKGTYTSLFFMDEATALAAGHRPCYFCRREAARTYAQAASKALGLANILTAADINRRIGADIKPHIRKYGQTPREVIDPTALPDGAMFVAGKTAFLKLAGLALPWSFDGYGRAVRLPETAHRLTPRLSIAALVGGYRPTLHESTKIRHV